MSDTSIMQLPVAIGIDGNEYIPLVQSGTTKRVQASLIGAAGLSGSLPAAIEVTLDGGGAAIGAQTWAYIRVPFAATITSATMLGDATGSLIIDVWKCTYSAYSPPTTPGVANSITSATPPTLTAASKSQDTSLSGWTTSLSEGDILAFNVAAPATSITKATLALGLARVVS